MNIDNNNSNNNNNNKITKFQTINLLLILFGLPACGKTYFSNKLIELIINEDQDTLKELINNSDNNSNNNNNNKIINIYHIEYDKIFLNINGSLNNSSIENWKPTRVEVYNQIYNISNNSNQKIILLNQFKPTKSYNYNNNNITNNINDNDNNNNNNNDILNLFILDDNMYYKSMRYKFYQLTYNSNNSNNKEQEEDIRYCQIYFPNDLKKSKELNNKRLIKNNVNDEGIEKMNNLFEQPNLDKNNWEKENTLFFNFDFNFNDSDNNQIKLILKDIKNKFYNFKKLNTLQQQHHYDNEELLQFDQKKENDKIITKNNIIHQFDLHCRKIISELMKPNNNSNSNSNYQQQSPYSNHSKLLSQYKQQFLKVTLTQFIHENNEYIQDYSDIIPYKEQLLNNFKNNCLDKIIK
ncbi:hypothetical protein ACTFIW_012893 [Dictyostelium discoideum]